jgi:adenosylcobinamide amidohydrolase
VPETPDRIQGAYPVILDLDYVEQAQVVRHRVGKYQFKSLVIHFKSPQEILSSFEGHLNGMLGIGNTFVPLAASREHMAHGVTQAKQDIRENLGFADGQFSTLMTGADMDNLAVITKNYKDLSVTALVTAGVKGNAMRMSKDTGRYFGHGTINIIVMCNRKLSPNARARSIITVTEAKSSALLDMDIRSAYTPWSHRATGTGTDNIIVVQGEGPKVVLAGGHSKIAELIARAVHEGVTLAILKQNNIKTDRNIFQRLADRRVSISDIAGYMTRQEKDKQLMTKALTTLLSTPCYAGFMELAMSVSDDHEKGLIKDLSFFDEMCRAVTARISGMENPGSGVRISSSHIPVLMARAFGALASGIKFQE